MIFIILFFSPLIFCFDFASAGTTNVTECGQDLNVSGEIYQLNTSIWDWGSDCLTIANESIILDCNGFNITYGGNDTVDPRAIDNENGYNNITIKNCIIVHNGTGIDQFAISFVNATDAVIFNNTITTVNLTAYGIVLADNSTNGNVSLNTITTSGNSSDAIRITDSDNSTINLNSITTSGNLSKGIHVDSSPYCNFTNNNITTTGYEDYGFYIFGDSNYYKLYNNFVNTTGDLSEAVYLNSCSYGNFSSNTIDTYGNESHGLYLTSSNNNSIFSNTIESHYESGTTAYYIYSTYLTTSVWNNISFNSITCNSNVSFALYAGNQCNNTFIFNNTIVSTGYSAIGISLYDNSNNVSGTNVIKNNVKATHLSGGIAIYVRNLISANFYNNIFNSTPFSTAQTQFYSVNNYTNYLNTSKTVGTNIVNKTYIGGNYWTTPAGAGYSDYCTNTNSDWICDSSFTATGNNIDYYPLTLHTNTTTSSNQDSSSSSPSTNPWLKGTFAVDQNQFQNGYMRKLIAKQRLRVEFSGEIHYVGVKEINENNVKIEVSSTPQEATLAVGDSRKFDLNDDGFYDVLVSLNSIADNGAEVFIKQINEDVTAESVEEEKKKEAEAKGEEYNPLEEGSGYAFIIAIIIIVLALAFGGRALYNKKK